MEKNKKTTPPRSPLANYAKYSSIAIQMFIIILLGIFGGFKLDKYIGWKFPLFTILFSIISVALAIYYAIKDLLK